MADTNKIKYGLCNVYYAKITAYALNQTTNKYEYTYATPVKFPGAVNLSLSSQASSNPFYADNGIYSTSDTNPGYEGDLEMAKIIDDFRKDILGEVYDSTKKQWFESSDAVRAEFALLFEFDGDVSKTRHCLYRCKATLPDIASQTKQETVDPVTETVTITVMPRENDHEIRTRCGTDGMNYDTWYSAVNQPDDAVQTYTQAELEAMDITELAELAEMWDIDTSEITTKAGLVTAILEAQEAAA